MKELEQIKKQLTALLANRAVIDEQIAEARALVRGVEHGYNAAQQEVADRSQGQEEQCDVAETVVNGSSGG